MPHSHDDAGWVKTIDEYYSGTTVNRQHASVRNILDSVVSQLEADPSRKFTYVEMVYFSRWYNA